MFSTSGTNDGSGASMGGPATFASAQSMNVGMNGGTSVYPPQPYAPQASPSVGQQPHRQFSRTNSSTNNVSNNSGGPSNAPTPQVAPSNAFASPSMKSSMRVESLPQGGSGNSRKRGASTSPGNGSGEGKEKKSRGAGENENANGTQFKSTSSTNGTAPEGRHWGEEANKLDVYVWDYLTRRGFSRAAKSLLNEAGMAEAPDVPLKTPQGLLFEYWAIFWDVFAARSGRASADALTYYQVQEHKLASKINETARRSEAMEALFAAPNAQSLFPQVLVNSQKSSDGTFMSAQTPGNSVETMGRQMNGQTMTPRGQTQQVQPSTTQTVFPGQQAPQSAQPQQSQQQGVGRLQGMPQQAGPSPVSSNTAGMPSAQATQNQQHQLLLVAAQRHNIPVEEIEKLSPQMRTALIQSVIAANNQGQTQMAVRPGGITGVGGNTNGMDAAAFQRLQQQQALQRQTQRGNLQQPIRPGMPGAGQGQQGLPGTPGMEGHGAIVGGQQGSNLTGPPQGQQGGQQPIGTMPQHMQQNPAQGFGGINAQAQRPGGAQETQTAPRLSPEQHQLLMSQFTTLQQALRQEVFQIDNAPSQEARQRAMQSAQQTQMRLSQLGSILKAQPGMQQQAGAFSSQQPQQQMPQQQRPMQARPQAPQQMPHQMGAMQNAGPFRPGLTPQQQQAMFAQQQQQQQRAGPNVGTPTQAHRPGSAMSGADPSVMMSATGASSNAINGQHQVQQSPQQMNDAQQRGQQFAFANPFAAGAGQASTPGSMSAGRRQSNSQDPETSFQQPQAPYATAQTPRAAVPQRVMSGMGPPQHISSPSPRLGHGPMSHQEGSIVGSPAMIPSTPRASGMSAQNGGSGTDKKKKETARGRKNSKTVSNASKTPVIGTNAGSMGTPTAAAQTPASTSMPTPAADQGPQSQNLAKNLSGDTQQSTPQGQASNSNQSSSNLFEAPGSAGPIDGQATFANLGNDANAPSGGNNGADGTRSNDNNQATDDLSQMFGSNDMSQFLDFEFSGGSAGFGLDSSSGNGTDGWDSSNLNALFGDG